MIFVWNDPVALWLLVIIVFFLLVWAFAYLRERIIWNKGFCLACEGDRGEKIRWEHFDDDSQGGSGYKCPCCNTTIWISYHSIDRKKHEDRIQN